MNLRTVTLADVDTIQKAVEALKFARNRLRSVGARKSADYVGRALKSAEGALRHAEGVTARTTYDKLFPREVGS